MTWGNRFLVVLLGLAGTTELGCTALLVGGGALAGAGAMAYARGDVSVVENVSLSDAWAATSRAMDDLSLTVVSQEDGIGARRLVAYGPEEKRVQVSLAEHDRGGTRIQIRVGLFGDQDLSLRLLDRIRQRL